MTEVDTSGIHVSPDQSIAVTFHVLVSKEAWKWDRNTKMTMRFGNKRLGNWMKDIVFLEECEEHGESGLVEMRCTLNFDVTILKLSKAIPYKYLIYVPQKGVQPTSNAYEYLHSAPSHGSSYINRCLVIPGDLCHAKGIVLNISSNCIELKCFNNIQANTINLTTLYFQHHKRNLILRNLNP